VVGEFLKVLRVRIVMQTSRFMVSEKTMDELHVKADPFYIFIRCSKTTGTFFQ